MSLKTQKTCINKSNLEVTREAYMLVSELDNNKSLQQMVQQKSTVRYKL